MSINKTFISAGALAVVALSGCGGGGGGGSDDAPAAPALATPWDASHLVAINADRIDRSTAGQGVTVAVVDTAFQPQHDEFPGSPTLTVVNGGNHQAGFRDHGTGVASMLGGANLGVAPQSILRLYNSGTADQNNPDGAGTSSGAADAILAAVSDGPTVLQTSIGLPANARTRDALTAAADADIVTVLTAGNDGMGLDGLAAEIGDPRYSGAVLVVGSFDRDADDLAANSNIATIEGTSDLSPAYIAAPGAFVCIATDDTGAIGEAVSTCGAPAAPGDDGAVSAYRYRGGTSYSAPQVAGAAALIRQSRPDLSAAQVVQIVLDSATDLGAAGYDGIYGAGLLNVAAALDAAAAAP